MLANCDKSWKMKQAKKSTSSLIKQNYYFNSKFNTKKKALEEKINLILNVLL